MLLRPTAAVSEGAQLHLTLGVCGAAPPHGPRRLSVRLHQAGVPVMPLLGPDGPAALAAQTCDIHSGAVQDLCLTLPAIAAGTLCVLHLDIDRTSCPRDLGQSDDPRQLGVLLQRLTLRPTARTTAPATTTQSA